MEKKAELIFAIPNVLTIFFSTESKKEDTIYMGIIYMSFLPRNLLCKNIYAMSSFMWSNELFQYTEMMTIPLLYFFIQFF